eukprot:2247661-Pyramimonas_sp.AAC.1
MLRTFLRDGSLLFTLFFVKSQPELARLKLLPSPCAALRARRGFASQRARRCGRIAAADVISPAQ